MRRIHNTEADELFLDGQYDQLIGNLKPRGLWYSLDEHWREWCESEWPERIFPNNFELEIITDKILVINSLSDAYKLTEKYKDDDLSTDLSTVGVKIIDWSKLTKDYSGVEFPDFWKLKQQLYSTPHIILIWVYSIDVPSGCIWDLSAVKKISKQT